MKLIRLLIALFLFGSGQLCFAEAEVVSEQDDTFGWMESSWDAMTNNIPSCITVPSFIDMREETYTLNLDNSGEWVATGNHVQKDKLLQFEWFDNGVQPRPSKYKVLYRIDPRFEVPQVFIQSYDYDTGQYISDFHQYKDGKLLDYQNNPSQEFNVRIYDFDDYFNFRGRSKIAIKKDDVINITLDSASGYFSSGSEMSSELGSNDKLTFIYTQSAITDNRVIYSKATKWCEDIIGESNDKYDKYCAHPKYFDLIDNWQTLEGRMNNNIFESQKGAMQPCSSGSTGWNNSPVCYYDKGRGITLSVDGTIIKPIADSFISSSVSGKEFFYYRSDISGDLDFITEWDIDDMYNKPQYMKDWQGLQSGNYGSAYNKFMQYMATKKLDYKMKFLHFGRYFLDVEVGNSLESVPKSELDAIQVEYKITSGETPDNSESGTSIDQLTKGNAPESGYLWLRVLRPNNQMTGTVQVKTTNYVGTTWFSDVIYNDLVSPLREKFNDLTKLLYTKLVTNTALSNISKTMLVLYIMVYALMFLAGATQITVNDIVIRVLKIAVIIALFSETSWTFFNENLFVMFTEGTDYLLNSVIGATGNATNIFGFVDPVFDKYTNPSIWFLLFIQLIHIHLGLTFFAIIAMWSILLYITALLEVIVGYCLAFLGLSVMISIAPLFIILMLFERTKSIFDNWLSTIFSYMVQPTILLIFFLLIDQIISSQILNAVVDACWEIIIPFRFHVDFGNSIPISFTFTLPFLPGIPFYVPQIESVDAIDDFFLKSGTPIRIATSSLLFFTLSKLCRGVVDYVTLLVQYLTNVLPARQYGVRQNRENPISDIMQDINQYNPVRSIGNFARSKVVDQRIDRIAEEKDENIKYSEVKTEEKGNLAEDKKEPRK